MTAISLLALLATPCLAQDEPWKDDHSDLIPRFPQTGNGRYDAYLATLDGIDLATQPLAPMNQLDMGMAGLYEPGSDPGIQIGEVLTHLVEQSSPSWYNEHWFFQGPFTWDAEMDVAFEAPGFAIHGSYETDPYIFMDIRYRSVPPAWATDGLTGLDPADVERQHFEVFQGGPLPTAWLMRELHHHPEGDRYVDHWLFQAPFLLLTAPGDEMELRHDPMAVIHTAAWFDVYRPGAAMYAKVKHQELTGDLY